VPVGGVVWWSGEWGSKKAGEAVGSFKKRLKRAQRGGGGGGGGRSGGGGGRR
jgi:hypothetical protein